MARTETSLDLLDRALASAESERELSRSLGLAANSLSTARQRGRLSPGVAASLAARLGENVLVWTLVAVMESERSEAVRKNLRALQRQAIAPATAALHRSLNP